MRRRQSSLTVTSSDSGAGLRIGCFPRSCSSKQVLVSLQVSLGTCQEQTAVAKAMPAERLKDWQPELSRKEGDGFGGDGLFVPTWCEAAHMLWQGSKHSEMFQLQGKVLGNAQLSPTKHPKDRLSPALRSCRCWQRSLRGR